ncbi:hypothetical protein MRB53_005097 [Persea americana]|uniref:Uncharacterized protein n=1 Tax=Persea americana TaxID=3435 RepID=A0ACC2MDD3_PERAE|nr:hypothetical protein MRB53_005097 [Persea americana]
MGFSSQSQRSSQYLNPDMSIYIFDSEKKRILPNARLIESLRWWKLQTTPPFYAGVSELEGESWDFVDQEALELERIWGLRKRKGKAFGRGRV